MFTFNDKIYKQKDGVSMGSPLGPLLANVFIAALEKDIIQKLTDKNLMTLYYLLKMKTESYLKRTKQL